MLQSCFFAALVPLLLANGPQTSASTRPVPAAAQQAEFKAITKNFDTWYRYTYYKVRLGRAFAGQDVSGHSLAKKEFLTKLATGNYLALRQAAAGAVPIYRLYAYAGPGRNEGIWTTSKQLAEIELNNYNREGQPLPAFRFVDLNGVVYTPASTRGKVLVVKCWYIGCLACVDEFPALNALADQYRQHPDVLFVSLATNPAGQLRQFLRNRVLKAAVVPDAGSYLRGALELPEYPTHFVVGRDGKVLRVTHNAGDLAAALKQAVPLAAR